VTRYSVSRAANDSPSLLVVGPHPDDCSIRAGGIAAKYVEEGHDVTFLSATDGSAGHHEMGRRELAARRKRETEAVAETLGVEYEVFDVEDRKIDALHCHESQMYEWLANDGLGHLVANTEMNVADRFRDELIERYGEDASARVEHAEAVEISEYGAPLTDELRETLFFSDGHGRQYQSVSRTLVYGSRMSYVPGRSTGRSPSSIMTSSGFARVSRGASTTPRVRADS